VRGGRHTTPTLIPRALTLQNFVDVVGTTDATGGWLFGRQLFNSLVAAGVTSAIGITLATTAGYAMSRFVFPGQKAGMQLFLITQMFPGVVMAIPLYILMDELGLLNSLLGLSLVYATTAIPFCTWNLKGYFDTIPKELEEAALMDGASRWTTFTRIVLPLAMPALVTVGLYSFMWAWNDLLFSLTLITKPELRTVGPGLLLNYIGESKNDWGGAMAASIVSSLPVVIGFAFLQRFFIQGLTAGAVKS
jgi:ABC-type glycerol-3-phosphate transport system permease component